MIEDRFDAPTFRQQCSNEHETMGPLTDGLCWGCLYPPQVQAITEYVISLYREDGTHDQSFRFRSKAAADKTWQWFSILDPRRVKFETFPPAGVTNRLEFPRVVRPEPAVPEVTAGALLSAEAK